LDAQTEEVFSFHENPHNIALISPPSLRVLSVEADPFARVGVTFRLVLRQYGIGLDWTGRWTEVVRPSLLVDEGEKCPLKSWRHEHRFQADGGRTLMTDVVSFALPWGKIFFPFVNQGLRAVFRARHRATAAYFRSASPDP